MNSLLYERPAPDILDIDIAQKAGEWLRVITDVQSNFFEYFEQPSTVEQDFHFTGPAFVRAVSDVLGGKDSAACFKSFLDAGLIRTVPGSEKAGLKTYRPTCRINNVEMNYSAGTAQAFVCTDSPIVDQSTRVFPWPDEGKELFKQITMRWTDRPPAKILDMCSGAGTAGLLLGNVWPEAQIECLDNSERALLYARFNARLNDIPNYRTRLFDLLKDTNSSNNLGKDKYDIVAIDPPFTPVPDELVGYGHSSIRKVTAAALRAAVNQVKSGGMIAMLAYEFGNQRDATPATLEKIFESVDLYDFEQPEISQIHGKVWRLEGEKSNPLNPMPVQYMAPRYYDRDWNHQFERAGLTYSQYVKWIEREFIEKGYSHLHYLSVILNKRRS